MADRERVLLEFLAEHGQSDLSEVADALDVHPISVDRACYSLQQKGYVRLVGDGVFTVTSEGKREL